MEKMTKLEQGLKEKMAKLEKDVKKMRCDITDRQKGEERKRKTSERRFEMEKKRGNQLKNVKGRVAKR